MTKMNNKENMQIAIRNIPPVIHGVRLEGEGLVDQRGVWNGIYH